MKRLRKLVLGVFALVLCGVLAVVFWPEKPEPVYKGRKLSEWVIDAATGSTAFQNAEFNEAVQAIGANGLPYYLRWLPYEKGSIRRHIFQLVEKYQTWVNPGRPPIDRKVEK